MKQEEKTSGSPWHIDVLNFLLYIMPRVMASTALITSWIVWFVLLIISIFGGMAWLSGQPALAVEHVLRVISIYAPFNISAALILAGIVINGPIIMFMLDTDEYWTYSDRPGIIRLPNIISLVFGTLIGAALVPLSLGLTILWILTSIIKVLILIVLLVIAPKSMKFAKWSIRAES